MSDANDKKLSDEEKEINAANVDKSLKGFFNMALHNTEIPSVVFLKSSPTTVRHLYEDLKNLWMAKIKFITIFENNHFRLYFPDLVLLNLFEKFSIIMRHLFQHGEHYERFWFKEKNFEKFVEAFEKATEEDFNADILGLPLELKNKLNESQRKEITKQIKKGTENFIEDLKKIRAELKENLRGWKYYGEQFTKWVLPWASIFLITLFGLLDKCNCTWKV